MATEVADDMAGCGQPKAAVLLIVGEPFSDSGKQQILDEIVKGLKRWNRETTGVDIDSELAQMALQASLGEEHSNGERVILHRSSQAVVELLVQPQAQTVKESLRTLLTLPCPAKALLFAGYAIQGNATWVMQDDLFTSTMFSQVFKDSNVENALKQTEGASLMLSTVGGSDWASALKGSELHKLLKVSVNPAAKMADCPGLAQFSVYVSSLVRVVPLATIMQASDVIGNISFSRPVLYIFPSLQGDAALFGMKGFNMLVDGGYSRQPCFWDFVRHLDGIDALLMTHLGADNLFGLKALLERKVMESVHPDIDYMYMNAAKVASGEVKAQEETGASELVISLAAEGSRLVEMSRKLGHAPHPLTRPLSSTLEPVNLFHKVGKGSLDMYILNPVVDAKETKEFLGQWGKQAPSFGQVNGIPVPNCSSICALLVVRPASSMEKVTRILFPGTAPQYKLLEGLERVKQLEFLKHPTFCTHDLHKNKKAGMANGRASSVTRRPVSVTTARSTRAEPPRHLDTKGPGSRATLPSPAAGKASKGVKDTSNKRVSSGAKDKGKIRRDEKEKEDKSKSSASSSPSKASIKTISPGKSPSPARTPASTSPDEHPAKSKPVAAKPAAEDKPSVLPLSNDLDQKVAPTAAADALTAPPTKTETLPTTDNRLVASPDALPDPDHFGSDATSGLQQPSSTRRERQKLQELGVYDNEDDDEGVDNRFDEKENGGMFGARDFSEEEVQPQALPEPVAVLETPTSSESDMMMPDTFSKPSLMEQSQIFEHGIEPDYGAAGDVSITEPQVENLAEKQPEDAASFPEPLGADSPVLTGSAPVDQQRTMESSVSGGGLFAEQQAPESSPVAGPLAGNVMESSMINHLPEEPFPAAEPDVEKPACDDAPRGASVCLVPQSTTEDASLAGESQVEDFSAHSSMPSGSDILRKEADEQLPAEGVDDAPPSFAKGQDDQGPESFQYQEEPKDAQYPSDFTDNLQDFKNGAPPNGFREDEESLQSDEEDVKDTPLPADRREEMKPGLSDEEEEPAPPAASVDGFKEPSQMPEKRQSAQEPAPEHPAENAEQEEKEVDETFQPSCLGSLQAASLTQVPFSDNLQDFGREVPEDASASPRDPAFALQEPPAFEDNLKESPSAQEEASFEDSLKEASPVAEDQNFQDSLKEASPVAEDQNFQDSLREASPVAEDQNFQDSLREASPAVQPSGDFHAATAALEPGFDDSLGETSPSGQEPGFDTKEREASPFMKEPDFDTKEREASPFMKEPGFDTKEREASPFMHEPGFDAKEKEASPALEEQSFDMKEQDTGHTAEESGLELREREAFPLQEEAGFDLKQNETSPAQEEPGYDAEERGAGPVLGEPGFDMKPREASPTKMETDYEMKETEESSQQEIGYEMKKAEMSSQQEIGYEMKATEESSQQEVGYEMKEAEMSSQQEIGYEMKEMGESSQQEIGSEMKEMGDSSQQEIGSEMKETQESSQQEIGSEMKETEVSSAIEEEGFNLKEKDTSSMLEEQHLQMKEEAYTTLEEPSNEPTGREESPASETASFASTEAGFALTKERDQDYGMEKETSPALDDQGFEAKDKKASPASEEEKDIDELRGLSPPPTYPCPEDFTQGKEETGFPGKAELPKPCESNTEQPLQYDDTKDHGLERKDADEEEEEEEEEDSMVEKEVVMKREDTTELKKDLEAREEEEEDELDADDRAQAEVMTRPAMEDMDVSDDEGQDDDEETAEAVDSGDNDNDNDDFVYEKVANLAEEELLMTGAMATTCRELPTDAAQEPAEQKTAGVDMKQDPISSIAAGGIAVHSLADDEEHEEACDRERAGEEERRLDESYGMDGGLMEEDRDMQEILAVQQTQQQADLAQEEDSDLDSQDGDGAEGHGLNPFTGPGERASADTLPQKPRPCSYQEDRLDKEGQKAASKEFDPMAQWGPPTGLPAPASQLDDMDAVPESPTDREAAGASKPEELVSYQSGFGEEGGALAGQGCHGEDFKGEHRTGGALAGSHGQTDCAQRGEVRDTPAGDRSSEVDAAEFDPLAEWGQPMGLPAPAPPEASNKNGAAKKGAGDTRKTDARKSTTASNKGKAASDKRAASATKASPKAVNGTADTPRSARSKPEAKKAGLDAAQNARSTRGLDTSKHDAKTRTTPTTPRRPASSTRSRVSPEVIKMPPLPPFTPFYVDLTYIPNHGDVAYVDTEFFKRVRARYYVLSARSPNPKVLEMLMEAKGSWDKANEQEVTVIPTYETKILQHWMAVHKEKLAENKIDIAPAASRCTVRLQDHEDSCYTYRLEF